MGSTVETATTLRAGGSSFAHPYRVLLALTGVALLINYVETMVLPGIPTIQKDLSTTSSIASWITSAFLIVGSAVSPLFGKLGDSYGKKKMALIALSFYTAGVGIAGFSPSIYFLLFSRAVQGIGFALVPLALAIITDVFPRERVAAAQGIISGTFAIGATAGLVVGSYVVQDLGWQWAFHSAFVLSIILFVIIARVIKRDVPGVKSRVDYVGASILMTAVTAILLYTTEGPSLGWYSPGELGLVSAGVVLTAVFFLFERGRTNQLIQFALLRIRNVMVANLVGVISGLAMFMLFFAVVYYAQLPPPFGLGLDIITAGLTLAPATIVMLAVGPAVGRLISKYGPKPMLIVGSLVAILGLALFSLNRANTAALALDVVVAFAGTISIIIPIVNMIAVSLPIQSRAVGLGMNTMLRNLGGAIGPVVATTIMTSYTDPITVNISGRPVVVGQLPSSTAFNLIFASSIALMVLVTVVALATKNYTFKPTMAREALAQQATPQIAADATPRAANQPGGIDGGKTWIRNRQGIVIGAEFVFILGLLVALSSEYQANPFMQQWFTQNAWPLGYLLNDFLAPVLALVAGVASLVLYRWLNGRKRPYST